MIKSNPVKLGKILYYRPARLSIPTFQTHFMLLGNLVIIIHINPCPAELFELYFSSFEAGIANAMSSFK